MLLQSFTFRLILFSFTAAFLFLFLVQTINAQEPPSNARQNESLQTTLQEPAPNEFYRAKVLEIVEEGIDESGGFPQPFQLVKVRLTSGPEKDKELEIKNTATSAEFKEHQKVKEGEEVIVVKSQIFDDYKYFITEKYRLPSVLTLFAIFLILILIFSGFKGFGSIIGLAFSILVIIRFIIPQIVDGKDPLQTSLIGALAIAFVSIYLAHGFSKRTTIALGSTILSIFIAAVLSTIFVSTAKLFGLGTEEAFYLQQGSLANIDLRGLLLGGIIIGALGVLDDITTAQTAAVDEIAKANPKFDFKELYKRGISVGKEHIASLVNTLALVYVAAALPIFLIFVSNEQSPPFWVLINNEIITEEVIRILVGSTSLVLAVPIATFLAAYFLRDKTQRKKVLADVKN